MARVSRTTEVPGPISAAEELWYDLGRRASFVEGFGHVTKVEGDWPRAGSRVVSDAPAQDDRQRVDERVEAFEGREGQAVCFEDAQKRGTQVTTFAADGPQVRVTVVLEWKLKEGNALTDWLFVRRRMGERLRRTLVKYRIERIADLDDERAPRRTAP